MDTKLFDLQRNHENSRRRDHTHTVHTLMKDYTLYYMDLCSTSAPFVVVRDQTWLLSVNMTIKLQRMTAASNVHLSFVTMHDADLLFKLLFCVSNSGDLRTYRTLN